MHLAGEAGDWQVANHELQEMKRMVGLAETIDPEKGKLFVTFMNGNLAGIQGAIEHGNEEKFVASVNRTVQSCNACHTAAGSPFIEVALDVPTMLTMRHPHALKSSGVGAMMHAH